MNNYGQLGNGTNTNSSSLSKVKLNDQGDYLENVVAVSAGGLTSYALTTDGEVYSWGYNSYGQFGIDNTSASNYPVKMQKVYNIIQISAGEDFLLMLDANGSVWGVGANGDGQLGLNSTNEAHLPQQMLKENGSGILYGVKEIATGRSHSVILKENGTVLSLGYNGYYQLGNGTNSPKYIPTQVINESGEAVTDAKHITAGGHSTYISRQKNTEGENQGLYVIGRNSNGNLFTQDTGNKRRATKVQSDKDIIAMAVTRNSDSSVKQTGIMVDQDGMVYTVGYNGNGEIGNGTVESTISKVCISKVKLNVTPHVINYKNVGDTGEKITCKVSAGFNLLYDNVEQGKYEFKSVDKDIADVTEDGVVTANGIGTTFIKVYNEQNDCYAGVRVQVNGEQGLTTAKIVGGWNHFVALKANGEVWTWGSNSNGQLGVSDKTNKQKPTKTLSLIHISEPTRP